MSPEQDPRSVIKIDLSAASDNFSLLNSLMEPGGGALMPVIKSDAYGHGMKRIAAELKKKPVWGFGVYECSEAEVLRKHGLQNRIFLLSGLLADSPLRALELSLTVGIVKIRELTDLDEAARCHGVMVPVHLKADTGMGRFGLAPEELLEAARRRNRWPNLIFEGLYTHMASADAPEDPFNKKQIERFVQLLRSVRDAGWKPELVHMANSAALVHLPETRFNLARPGIAIYGSLPSPGAKAPYPGLRPVMSFTSRLIQVRSFLAGDSFSYGHTFTAAGKMLIGLVPVGYDNGYPRSLSNRAHVLVGGKRCPVVGNICMKALLVDLTGAAGIHEGEEVILLGRSGGEQIFIEELSQKAGTISYELLCLLGKLNRRIILE